MTLKDRIRKGTLPSIADQRGVNDYRPKTMVTFPDTSDYIAANHLQSETLR